MSQVIAPRALDYLVRLHKPFDETVEAIRAEGLAAGLPLVDQLSARLLRSLVIATRASKVLEIGTAIGYSAICMAQVMPPDGALFSIEIDAERAATARRNAERAGVGERVHVIVGDASRFLHKVSGPFDLVFQDGPKRLYEPLLDKLIDHLRPGGLLVSDNVLWHGEVVPGLVESPSRDPIDTEAIRRYNERLSAEPRLLTTLLPVGDGLAVSVKLP